MTATQFLPGDIDCITLMSGGADSAVAAYLLRDVGARQAAMFFDYGQQNYQGEVRALVALAKELSIPVILMDLRQVFKEIGHSALVNHSVPDGDHDETGLVTYVPNRNMIFLSTAVGYAHARDIPTVSAGFFKSHAVVHKDTTPEFADAFNGTLAAQGMRVRLRLPLARLTKPEVIGIGRSFGVPFRLTWSCFRGGKTPCGKCGACIDRTAVGTDD